MTTSLTADFALTGADEATTCTATEAADPSNPPESLLQLLGWTGSTCNDIAIDNTTGDGACTITNSADDGVEVVSIPNPDHWNVIGSKHEICLIGNDIFDDGLESIVSVIVTNQNGANAALVGAPRQDDEWSPVCFDIRSTTPGETVGVTVTWSNTTDSGTVMSTQIVGGAFVKEWSELTDSVIIVAPTFWSSSVKDGASKWWSANFGGILNNHVDDIDWQYNNDQQGTTITSDVNSMVKLIEISHGEHQTQFGPAEGQGFKVDAAGTSHVAVDHAIVTVKVDSPRGCTDAEIVDSETGAVSVPDAVGLTRTFSHGAGLIKVTAICEEIATITIYEDYPSDVASVYNRTVQWIKINWTTKEVSKQPHIRKAGEEIILEHKWGTPTDGQGVPVKTEDLLQQTGGPFFCKLDVVLPNNLLTSSNASISNAAGFGNVVNLDDLWVKYTELAGPGALIGGWKTNLSGDADDFSDRSSGGEAKADLDRWCVSRALYSSEDPGEVDVEAALSINETSLITSGQISNASDTDDAGGQAPVPGVLREVVQRRGKPGSG